MLLSPRFSVAMQSGLVKEKELKNLESIVVRPAASRSALLKSCCPSEDDRRFIEIDQLPHSIVPLGLSREIDAGVDFA